MAKCVDDQMQISRKLIISFGASYSTIRGDHVTALTYQIDSLVCKCTIYSPIGIPICA